MPDSLQAHSIYTENEWDNVEYFQKVLNFIKERKIRNVLDVGGCTGKVSETLLKLIPTIENITIIEPIEENYNFILNSLKNNSKIKVLQNALFYGQDYIQLGQCDDNVGGWSYAHSGNQTKEIKTITLESFLDIDFLKLDIEGAEKNIIENSSIIHSIPYIEIEFHFELLNNWENYIKENLKNHKIQFHAGSERANGFFVREDLIK